MSIYRVSQLIASSKINFELKNDSRTVVIDFLNNFDIDSLLTQLRLPDFNSIHNLSLHFENLKGNNLLPVIDVYLNLENEKTLEEENCVGAMALYGLGESSIKSDEHDGTGQDRVMDVGPVFSKVRSQSNWSNKQFKLTLVPQHSLSIDARLTIGRITLYLHQL